MQRPSAYRTDAFASPRPLDALPMTARKALLTLHLWLGLVSAPFLLVLGLTGAIMAYEEPLGDWLNARLMLVTPKPERLTATDLVDRVLAKHDGARLLSLTVPPDERHSYQITIRTPDRPAPERLYVDPYSARVLGTNADERHTLDTIHQLHLRLLAGDTGQAIVAAMGVALLFLSLSGLWLWWPGKIVRVRSDATTRRMTLDLHNAIGIWSFVFLLVFAVTGIIIHWNDAAQRAFSVLTASNAGTLPPTKTDACRTNPNVVAPDGLLAIAQSTVPGARPVSLRMPANDQPLVAVTMRYPEDRTPAGRTIVVMAMCTGRVLYRQDTRTVALGYKIPRVWNRELHTGDLFGWPHRLLAALFSLALPFMALTGPLIWWQRRNAERRRELRSAAAA